MRGIRLSNTCISGALVPIARGQMRNRWFPFGIAEYVTAPELKTLRLRNVPMERDFQFGAEKLAKGKKGTTPEPEVDVMDVEEIVNASAFQKKVEVEKLSPERSVELIERFVRPQLEFYRQPILEEVKEVEPEEPPPEPRKMANYGTGAAADLLAARAAGPVVPQKVEKTGPQAIYGSVSPLDVLQAVRAALQEDDEAKRVVLSEQDVQFIDLPETEKVVKHVGTFVVEIQVKGAEEAVSRIVRVIPQEL